MGGAPASLNAEDAAIEAIPREVLCNCEGAHNGRPDDVLAGCGRFWMGMVRRRADGSWWVEPLTDVTLYPALRMLAEDERTQDVRVRSAAEKWIGAVTGLCALFSLAGLATAKDAVAGIDTWGRVIVALLYAAALGCAAVALLTGYTAAYGWLTYRDTMSIEQVRAYYKERREGPQSAAKRLNRAVILACVTLGLLSTIVLLLWFLPRHTAAAAPPAATTLTSAIPSENETTALLRRADS
jgi:hypothetical protein